MDFIAVPKLKIRLEVGTTGKGEQGGFLPFGIILPYQAMLGLMGGMLVFVCCCCSCMVWSSIENWLATCSSMVVTPGGASGLATIASRMTFWRPSTATWTEAMDSGGGWVCLPGSVSFSTSAISSLV